MNKYIELGANHPQITYSAHSDIEMEPYGWDGRVIIAVCFDGHTEIGVSVRVSARTVEQMTEDMLLVICDRMAYSIIKRLEERRDRPA